MRTSHLQKIYLGCVQISPSKKSLVTLNSVKCAFFVLFDYAVSISFRTIN